MLSEISKKYHISIRLCYLKFQKYHIGIRLCYLKFQKYHNSR